MMAMLMHVVSSYCGGMSECVTNAAASASSSSAHNLTGGYANDGNNGSSHSGATTTLFDPFITCGASGPVGFVSFLSGLLFWLNVVLAAVLYTKREAILSGDVGSSNQYDEIGGDDGRGFAGDFPSSTGMRTMHV